MSALRIMCTAVAALGAAAVCGCRDEKAGSGSPVSKEYPPLVEADRSFTYGGKPIHASFLKEFAGDCYFKEGYGRAASVNLAMCATSVKYFEMPCEVGKDGSVTFAYKEDRSVNPDALDEWYSYRHLGRTPSGTHVLATAWNSGGSGIWMAVLLVRFEADDVYEDVDVGPQHRRRLLMRYVGSITRGDRDDGTVEFKDGKVILGKSRYRESPEEYEID